MSKARLCAVCWEHGWAAASTLEHFKLIVSARVMAAAGGRGLLLLGVPGFLDLVIAGLGRWKGGLGTFLWWWQEKKSSSRVRGMCTRVESRQKTHVGHSCEILGHEVRQFAEDPTTMKSPTC